MPSRRSENTAFTILRLAKQTRCKVTLERRGGGSGGTDLVSNVRSVLLNVNGEMWIGELLVEQREENESAPQKVVGWTNACFWKVNNRRASSTLIPEPYFALSFSISA